MMVFSLQSSDISTELGLRPRRACNCTKSQCLKLYCDCFANGEFCNRCNCNNCYNNLNYEELRQKAIRACLERNPNAFRSVKRNELSISPKDEDETNTFVLQWSGNCQTRLGNSSTLLNAFPKIRLLKRSGRICLNCSG